MSEVMLFPQGVERSWINMEKVLREFMTKRGIPKTTAESTMQWAEAKIKPLFAPTDLRIALPILDRSDFDSIRQAVEDGVSKFSNEEHSKRIRLIGQLIGARLGMEMDGLV